MTNSHTYNFIEGEFLPQEIREIILSIFKSKIHFHRMKNFSSQERFGVTDEGALKKIIQLQATADAIIEEIEKADERGERLKITADIVINSIA